MTHPLNLKIPPALIAGAVAFIQLYVARELPFLSLDIQYQSFLAVFLASAGAAIAIWGVVAFRKASTTVNPHTPSTSSSLVTSGPFQWTRNPMYSGMAIVLVAWSVHLGHVGAAACVLLFVGYITKFQIMPEEEKLRELFPEDFDAYCSKTGRWL